MTTDVTEKVDLDLGVVVGEACHTRAVLRAARLADTYAAAGAVAVPDDLKGNVAASIAYQMAVDDAQVLAQVVELGSLDPVPSIEALIEAIDPDDMALLRAGAARLKKKLRQSRPGFPPIVEPSISSSEPGSA